VIAQPYPSATYAALTSDMSTNLRLVLMTSAYVYNPSHDSYSDLSGFVVNATSPAGGFSLVNVAVTQGASSSVLSADDVTVNPATVTFRSYAIYQDSGTKPLLLHCDYQTDVVVTGTALVFQLDQILKVET
jgi:hypothetical protein